MGRRRRRQRHPDDTPQRPSVDDRHGAPLRLVSPSQYAYKSVKHLTTIDFRVDQPTLMPKERLRARVASEERHPKLPNWAVKLPYRLMIPPTAYLAERTLHRHRATQPFQNDGDVQK